MGHKLNNWYFFIRFEFCGIQAAQKRLLGYCGVYRVFEFHVRFELQLHMSLSVRLRMRQGQWRLLVGCLRSWLDWTKLPETYVGLLSCSDAGLAYTQYTPPTPTRLICRVELRRRRVGVGGVY